MKVWTFWQMKLISEHEVKNLIKFLTIEKCFIIILQDIFLNTVAKWQNTAIQLRDTKMSPISRINANMTFTCMKKTGQYSKKREHVTSLSLQTHCHMHTKYKIVSLSFFNSTDNKIITWYLKESSGHCIIFFLFSFCFFS